MFKKILVPIDGSESSMKALVCAADIGSKYDSELLILNVLYLADSTDMELSAASKELLHTAREELKHSANSLLEKAKKRLVDYPHKITEMVEIGNISETILAVCSKEKCDAIALGTRGASKLSEVIIGSTTYHVVQHAGVPVLTVRV